MITNSIIESFLQCKYKSYLQFNNESGVKTDYELVQHKICGLYKKKFYEKLQMTSRIRVLPTFDFQDLTQDADDSKLSYAITPCVQSKDYVVGFDAVEISHLSAVTRTFSYIPINISSRGSVMQHEKLALAVRCLIVSQLQHISFEFGKIFYGTQLKPLKFRLSGYLHESQRILRALRKVLRDENAPRFFYHDHCKVCEFQEVCRVALREKDDLSLLGRISEKEVLKQNNRGIFTIHQLSYTYRPRRKRKKTSSKNGRLLWELKALALREHQTFIQEIPKLRKTAVAVYLDFEGVPDEHYHYLIGIVFNDGETEKQMSFWASSPMEEETIFRQLFKILSQYKDFCVYHYGAYEIQVLKKLNKKWMHKYEQEIDRIIDHSVNLLSLISSNIYFPTYTNELKEIANFLGFRWTEDNASGIQSIVWRKRWDFTHDGSYKDKLIRYNIEDCLALQVLKEWLVGITQKIEEEGNEEVVKAEEAKVKTKYLHAYCRFQSLNDDLEEINRYAYFDYQREKIFLKSNTQIKKALKRGKQKHHAPGKINNVTQTPRPLRCPRCHHEKVYRHDTHTKTTYDLKFVHSGVRRWVTQSVGMGFECSQCKKHFVPERNKRISKHGHNLMSWVINQHIAYRVTIPSLTQSISESFDISLSGTAIMQFKSKLADFYADTYEEIQHHILHGLLLHADETCVEVKGFPSSYVWVFTSMDSVFYVFKPNREAEFLKELLAGFSGVLVTDFYPGYESLPCAQQKCLIHLIRDLNDDLFTNQLDFEFKELVTHFGQLLRMIMETIHKYGLKQRHLHKHKKNVDKFYTKIINKEGESELLRSYQKRFQKNRHCLFTFLDYDNIPWNNNNAEHAIKFFGLYRNIADGLFTEQSIQKYLILLTVQQTCKYRGIRFIDFLISQEKSIEAYTKKH